MMQITSMELFEDKLIAQYLAGQIQFLYPEEKDVLLYHLDLVNEAIEYTTHPDDDLFIDMFINIFNYPVHPSYGIKFKNNNLSNQMDLTGVFNKEKINNFKQMIKSGLMEFSDFQVFVPLSM